MAQQARCIRVKSYQDKPQLKELDKLLQRQIKLNLALIGIAKENSSLERNKFTSTVQFYSWALQPRIMDFGYWALRN